MSFEIIPDRLSEVSSRELLSGGHKSIESGMCVMEAVSYVAGEPWSDTPACACPVIASFMRSWNDSLPDAKRNELLRPLIARLVGTKSTPEIEVRRSLMAADWFVRTHTVSWLRLAGLTAQADALAVLPEITAMAQVPGIRPAIEAVRRDASAARAAAAAAARAAAGDAAWDAAWAAAAAAARAAAGDAAGDAARAAARAAAGDAAWYAAGDAAWYAAGDAAWDAAWYAAWDAAWDAAKQRLAPTVAELQASALVLIERMISAN